MDGFARARASMALRAPSQGLPVSGPPTLSLGGTTSNLSSINPGGNFGTSFAAGNQAFANSGTSGLGHSMFFPSSATALGAPSTPGVFGSTMSPFANNSQSSIFQTSGKRGKH